MVDGGAEQHSLAQDYETDAKNVGHHYNVGNDFYRTFLVDSLHAYTCGFWHSAADTLETAQINKISTIIKKLDAKPGDKILDLGCGWGHIMSYIASQTKADLTGISIADEQIKYIKENIENVRAINMHYKDLPDAPTFDKIYSIGIVEHVRCVNLGDFFKSIYRCLKPNGRFVMHGITYSIPKTHICNSQDATFVNKYIFPNGQIPTRDWIIKTAANAGFKLVHMEAFGGQNYYRTLKAWRNNILSNQDKLKEMGYTDEIIRMYDYYMASCAAAFTTDVLNVTHFVLDKIDYLDESVVF
jgi:cyclopropane-fatty-acyl-phospholipid synthase